MAISCRWVQEVFDQRWSNLRCARSYLLFQWQRPIDSDSLCLIYGWTGEKYFFSKWIRSPSVKVMVPMELCDHSSNLASIFARFTPKFNIAFVCSCADQEISVGGIPNSKEVCICKVDNLIATFSLLEHCGQSTKVYLQSTTSILSTSKTALWKYKKYTFKVQKYTFKVQNYTFNLQKHTFKVQKHTFKVRKYIVKVQKHTFKVYFQRTRVHFQNCKKILSAYKSILSTKVEKYTCKAQQIYFQRTNAYFQSTKVHFQSTRVYFRFEVQSNCRKPWPGTFLIPRGTRFPETVPSNPREQNLTPRNPSNTETFETSFTQPSEPEPWNRKTCRNPSKAGIRFPELVPGTSSRNRFPEPGSFPEPPQLAHTEIYIVQRPHSILLLGKKKHVHTYVYVHVHVHVYVYLYTMCLKSLLPLLFLYEVYWSFISSQQTWRIADACRGLSMSGLVQAASRLWCFNMGTSWSDNPFLRKKKKNEKSRKQSTFLPMKHIFQWIDMVGWHKIIQINHSSEPGFGAFITGSRTYDGDA